MLQRWILIFILALGMTTGAFGLDWIVDTAHPDAAADNSGMREVPLKNIGAGTTSNAFRLGGVL